MSELTAIHRLVTVPSVPQPPQLGTWIRGWRLDRLIHVGNNACVYRAVAEEGSVVGALKALRPSAIAHRTAAERFAREIAALKGLTHPAIPRLLDHGIDEDSLPWFVTEWLVGWDLETHRVRLGGRLPATEVVDVGVRLLDALAHAHVEGFVHRDVKPANLFLTETGDLKVLDFGLCRGLAAACDFGITGNVVIGTPAFMAPEQAARRWGQIDARSDLWAVGATLFLLASGRPVHEGTADEQRRAAYREDARSLGSLVSDLPAGLVAAVDRALLRDPNSRFQSAEQMRDSLQGAFHPADVSAAPFHSAGRRPLSSEPGVAAARRPQEPPPRTALSDSMQRHPTEQDRELGPVLAPRPGTSLIVVSSPDTWAPRKRELLQSGELLIGRDSGPMGWSFADTRVSRVHARVAWDDRQGCFRATDLNSTNGMRVNAARKATMPLSSGDVLRIGDTVLVVSQGPSMAELRSTIEQAARSSATLLITGETGVGKEVISRQIHAWSGRSGAFVPVNCGALPRDIAASELFGHAKGAFSGAASARRGVFHAAQGGTILLDEVGELPLELQPLLLRTLQEKAVRPVGTDHEQQIDVRVIAATNVRLDSAVAEGLFRADLYARLAQIPIELPPLRQRREEVLSLAATFATQASAQFAITADAAEALLLWSWPFNVRELENLIRRWCAMTQPGTQLGLEFLHSVNPAMTLPFQERGASQAPASGSSTSPGRSPSNGATGARNPLSDRSALEALLVSCEGNVSEVARRLNTTRAQVYRWMDRLGLDASRTRTSSPPRRGP